MESYRNLSAGLLRGLAALGVSAQADRMRLRGDRRDRAVAPVCFEQPSHYEITWQGKKLLGSAQMRKAGMILQHGTLPLAGDIARIGEALHFETEEQREQVKLRVRQRATTLAEVLGRAVSWEAAAQALAQGLAEMLNLTLWPGQLTEAEQALAARLRAEKYATPAWNLGAGRLPASPALDV
jgi:lipoate-protein ligase A